MKKCELTFSDEQFCLNDAVKCPKCGESYMQLEEPQEICDEHNTGYFIPMKCDICKNKGSGILVINHEGNTYVQVIQLQQHKVKANGK